MSFLKASLREKKLSGRILLSSRERGDKSRQISRNFMDIPVYQRSKVIMLYKPIKGEVDTLSIINRALREGKIVCLPRVNRSNKTMGAYRLISNGTGLKAGPFGILEPDKNVCPRIPDKLIDLIVIPGIAFNLNGFRLGFGGGFYDRFLKKTKSSTCFSGVCYENQLVSHDFSEPHDVPVDLVITEKRVIVFSEKGRKALRLLT